MQDAFEPVISRRSVDYHWDVHQRGVLRSLNRQLDSDERLKRLPLEELVRESYNRGNPTPVFNAAAEVRRPTEQVVRDDLLARFRFAALVPGLGTSDKMRLRGGGSAREVDQWAEL